MSEKKDEFKEWVVSTFDEEAEQELRRLQEKEDELQVPEGVKEAVFARLQEQRKERNERDASRQPDEEDDDILSQLSPEDREALELGRKMMKAEIGRDEKDNKKPRRRKKSVKIYLVLAAVIICVMAMGITSIGGPERVVRMVRQAVGDRDVEKSSTGKKVKTIENEDEEVAYEEIENKLKINPVRMVSGPEDLIFEEMIFDEESQVAEVIYKYKGNTVVYLINAAYRDSSFGINVEDEKLNVYDREVKKRKIIIKEYKVKETKEYRYTASFKEKGIEYYIVATMKRENFEEILDNLIFSN